MMFSMFAGIICLLVSVSIPFAAAGGPDEPVLVRKKIETVKNNHAVPQGGVDPKVDLATIEKNSPANRIAFRGAEDQGRTNNLYDPTGKIDPFKPVYEDTPEVKQRLPEYAVADAEPMTDLEKIGFSQLRLTGIILAKRGNKGLVREASGKGFIISEGSGIGRYGGIVAGILNDRIIHEQKMLDYRGKELVEKREFKINKIYR
jgi:type IV pilus assembly protein PilP